MAGYSEVIE